MPRTLVVVLLGMSAWAAMVDAQANKAPTVSHYAPPRMPWGDPDLQGTFTNKYELNTPFERPEEFERPTAGFPRCSLAPRTARRPPTPASTPSTNAGRSLEASPAGPSTARRISAST